MLHLEGHPSGIKEKIETQLGDSLEENEEGISGLLDFLRSIYDIDDMADSFSKYMKFEQLKREGNVSIQDFIANWEKIYHKTKKQGCEISDMVLAFKLLHACNISEMDIKLVLTGVNYKEGKEKKNMMEQTKESLKKFVGRSVIGSDNKVNNPKAVESTFVTKEELSVLLSQQDKKKKKKERRRSTSLPGDLKDESTSNALPRSSNYKGKKNPLGPDFLPLKCFRCKCKCTTNCNCKCRYHFISDCKESAASGGSKADVSLFMKANAPR